MITILIKIIFWPIAILRTLLFACFEWIEQLLAKIFTKKILESVRKKLL